MVVHKPYFQRCVGCGEVFRTPEDALEHAGQCEAAQGIIAEDGYPVEDLGFGEVDEDGDAG